MAYFTKWTEIGKTRIKIATGTRGEPYNGDTQTINVCDANNLDGNYREVYRISKPFLSVDDIKGHGTLAELDQFLIKRGATKEGPRKRSR